MNSSHSLDDDAIPEPDWLDRLIAGFSDPMVAAVGGFIRDHTGVKFQYRCVIGNRFADVRHSADVDAPRSSDEYASPTGTNVAFRRDTLVGIGGFDEQYAYFLDETDINIRLHDEGWAIRLVAEAQVHHKYLENRIRDSRRRPKSRYVIARSKAYFSWTHGSKTKAARQIRAYLWSYCLQQTCYLYGLFLMRRIGWCDVTRMLGEVERGVQDGTSDANQARRHRVLAPLAAGAPAVPFRPFRTRLPVEWRMRLCFLMRVDHLAEADEATCNLFSIVRTLAVRGHEISVICMDASRHASVEFIAGFWLHRLASSPFRRLLSGGTRGEWLRLAEAGSREIARVQCHRQFQVVVVPAEGRLSAPALRDLNLPVAVVRFGAPAGRPLESSVASHRATPGDIQVIALEGGDMTGAVVNALEFRLTRIAANTDAADSAVERQYQASRDAG